VHRNCQCLLPLPGCTFSMKNTPTTFQRLIQQLTGDFLGCEGYIDDVVICSSSWENHVKLLRQLFSRLGQANHTGNFTKSEFRHCQVTFLGHVVGQGKISPVMAKVAVFLNPVTEES